LLLAVVGPVRLIYIPSTLLVRGNATATANNIAVHESLFRFGIVSDLLTGTIAIFVVLALYRLLKGVNQNHAVLMVTPALRRHVKPLAGCHTPGAFAHAGGLMQKHRPRTAEPAIARLAPGAVSARNSDSPFQRPFDGSPESMKTKQPSPMCQADRQEMIEAIASPYM
jgi:hypothetical protein